MDGIKTKRPQSAKLLMETDGMVIRDISERERSSRDMCVAVTMAWRVLRLRMEGRSPEMEGSCEYTE